MILASYKRVIFAVAWALLDVANFYEKALFVKVDLATALWWTQRLSVPFALCFYPRSLGELTLVGSSAHYGIRLDSGSTEALRSS
jgi:hypothetical protein